MSDLLAVRFPHSVAAKSLYPFCSNAIERNFFMIKQFFGIRKLSVRELCTLGMLLALTTILAVFLTVRIGEGIKIPTKFLSISVASMLFGPLYGGLIGALADILTYAVNPVAYFMPQITFVEFLYGFTYGLFLRNLSNSAKGYISVVSCVLFQIVFIHILLTSYFLMPVMQLSYPAMLAMRLPAAAVNCALQIIGVCFVVKYSDAFRRLSAGGAIKWS